PRRSSRLRRGPRLHRLRPHAARATASLRPSLRDALPSYELENSFTTWVARLHPSERKQTLALVRQFTRKPWPDFETEFRLRHRDGSYRWICCRAEVLYDDNGDVRKMVGTHLDVTERKEAEERIRGFVKHDSLTSLPN